MWFTEVNALIALNLLAVRTQIYPKPLALHSVDGIHVNHLLNVISVAQESNSLIFSLGVCPTIKSVTQNSWILSKVILFSSWIFAHSEDKTHGFNFPIST